MTDRELMQQALEALEVATTPLAKDRQEVLRAQAALRERLAQPDQWQGRTEAEKINVAIDCGCADVAWMDFADAIEAKLKEKNT